MKKMKKFITLALVLVMVLGLATTAFAEEVDTEKGGNATITVQNAVNGETYTLVKLFDANVTGNSNGSIYYTTTNVDANGKMAVPDDLKDYFEVKTTIGEGTSAVNVDPYIVATAAATGSDGLSTAAVEAITAWAKAEAPYATGVADEAGLVFKNLDYGYYVVLSSFGKDEEGGDHTYGAAIAVDSTNPNGVLLEKNAEVPVVVKKVDDKNVSIGDTVTYTATFDTVNMLDGEVVADYIIQDTLPDWLSLVNVKEITIGGEQWPEPEEGDTYVAPDFGDVDGADGNKYTNAIQIPWATYTKTSAEGAEKETGYWTSTYTNGTVIKVVYEAVVNNNITVGGEETTDDFNDGNVNKVSLLPLTGEPDNDKPDPYKRTFDDYAEIYTFAAALQKVDENKKPLAGAKFKAQGLTVTGAAGVYTVTAFDPTSEDYGTEMVCDAEGQLVILGLDADISLTVIETEAPAGYNKLTDSFTLNPVKTSEEIKASQKTVYYDANGNVTNEVTDTVYQKNTYNVELLQKAIVVVNNKGTSLPTTGGMGTTMFYVFGAVMVMGAAVLLVTKKRMAR